MNALSYVLSKVTDLLAHKREEWNERHCKQGQSPVENEHRDQRRDDDRDVRKRIDEGVADNVLHATNVRNQTRLDVAGLGLSEKPKRHALQMGEQVTTHFAHDSLTNDDTLVAV